MSSKKISVVTCFGCRNEFPKETKYVNSAEKKGRNHFCSRSCQAKHKNRTDPRWSHIENLRKGRVEDEYSPFRWIFQRTKARNKCNLDLETIKQQWDEQKGICALSGLEMKLRHKHISIFEQASLDRIDSSKPYEKGNIQFVILSLNYAKSNTDNREFVTFLAKLRK